MKKFNRMKEVGGMHTYTFLICDGNAAASRGGERDKYFEVETKAFNLKEALQDIWESLFYEWDSFEDFCEDYMEDDEEDDPSEWTEEELLDYIDGQDISGGASWIEAYMIDGEMVRNPDSDYVYDDEGELIIDVKNPEKWGLKKSLFEDYEDDDEFEESKKNMKLQSSRVREGLIDKAIAKMKNLGYEALGGDEALAREIEKYKAHPGKYTHSPLKDLVDKLLIKNGFMDESGMFYDDVDCDYLEDDDFTDYDEIVESLKKKPKRSF